MGYSLNHSQVAKQKAQYGQGDAVVHIYPNGLGKVKIPLPPLPEQQRIVSNLDEDVAAIAKAKANAEQNLKNAKALFESYLQGVFENGNGLWIGGCKE